MKKIFVLTIASLVLLFTACPTTQQSTKTAGDEVGSAVVDEATEAVKDNARKEVRDGVNDAFKKIF